MSIANKPKSKCSGCNACAEICPKHCITMRRDYKGFYYPQVNKTQCIECNLCTKICPFSKGNIEVHYPQKAYAAWNKDIKSYLSSSSGGVGFVLAKHILKNNGIVYGCIADKINIKHIRINKLEDLHKLQGSKYVQSNTNNLFAQIKDDLIYNVPILFIGTPCQVAGLKNYLKYLPKNLYLVDLICHGVPSLKMLHDHIKHIIPKHNIEQISFRKGTEFVIELNSTNFTYQGSMWDDNYYKGFMDGIIYRESCYHCIFAQSQRVSDITIGDFWGLKENATKLPQNGISVILPLTLKGLHLIEDISPNLNIYERPINEAINGNSQLRNPSPKNKRYYIFNLLYHFINFDIALSIVYSNQYLIFLSKRCINKIIRIFNIK